MQRTDRRFTIRHLLGRGGFGEVYRATMTTPGGLEAEVAVKLLRTADADGDHVRRLRDEGRLLSALQHPAILRVWDLASLDGRVGLVTEFVPGQDLGDCFDPSQDDPMPIRALVEGVAQVAEGLEAAWAGTRPGSDEPIHIVHRDIKPSNLRVGPHGQVKILDFGIAHTEHADREAKTGANSTLGSLAYMAPERFGRRAPGPECDVYSLGCVLFEGLSGQRLHPDAVPLDMAMLAARPKAWDAHVDAALEALPEDLPTELRDLLRRTLQHDPDARPTAPDLAAACDELAPRLVGTTLKRWARDRTWPDEEHEGGNLGGRVLTDGTLDTGATSAVSEETFQFDGSGAEFSASTAPVVAEPAPKRSTWIALAVAAVALLGAVGVGAMIGGSTRLEAPAPTPTAAPDAPQARAKSRKAKPPPTPAPAAAPVETPSPDPSGTDEVAPRPAPQAVAPAPAPAPTPPDATEEPDPPPPPEPTAAPEPVPMGEVAVSGATLVKVEVGGLTVPANAVPARQEVFLTIDFGADAHRLGPYFVSDGTTLRVRCVRMTQECSIE